MTDKQDQESKTEKTQNLEEKKEASVEEIRKRINQQPGPIDFEIGTCPKPTFAWFKAEAKEKYADNYGLTLTMLKERLEAYERNQEQIQMLRERISRLEDDIDEFVEALNQSDENSSSRGTLNTDGGN